MESAPALGLGIGAGVLQEGARKQQPPSRPDTAFPSLVETTQRDAQALRNLTQQVNTVCDYLRPLAEFFAAPNVRVTRDMVAGSIGATPACPDPPLGLHFPPTSYLVVSSTLQAQGLYDLMPRAPSGKWWAQRSKDHSSWFITEDPFALIGPDRQSCPLVHWQPGDPPPAGDFHVAVSGATSGWGRWEQGLRYLQTGLAFRGLRLADQVQAISQAATAPSTAQPHDIGPQDWKDVLLPDSVRGAPIVGSTEKGEGTAQQHKQKKPLQGQPEQLTTAIPEKEGGQPLRPSPVSQWLSKVLAWTTSELPQPHCTLEETRAALPASGGPATSPRRASSDPNRQPG